MKLLYFTPLLMYFNLVRGFNMFNRFSNSIRNVFYKGIQNDFSIRNFKTMNKNLNMRTKKNYDFNSNTRYMSPFYKPRSENQGLYVKYLCDKNIPIVIGVGPAGSGKTLFACNQAVLALKSGAVDKIILTRPVVPVEEDIGFLPGSLINKMDPWTRPIFDILLEFYQQKDIDGMLHSGALEISPLAYMRGRTLDNAFIILDESQNANDLQIKMFLTRIGSNAKAIITGDPTQVDLPRNQKSGLDKAVRILQNIEGIAHIQLDEEDVVRHKLVKAIIRAYDKERENETENSYHR